MVGKCPPWGSWSMQKLPRQGLENNADHSTITTLNLGIQRIKDMIKTRNGEVMAKWYLR